MKGNFRRVLLVAALLLAPRAVFADDDGGDLFSGAMNAADKAYKEATAKVEAAKTPIEKISALYDRSHAPEKGWAAFVFDADWQRAADDIDEALRLVAEVEADGKTEITGKAGLYFQKGYIAAELKDYSGAIAAYNDAEKWGYEKLHPKTGGASLWNNRGNARANLHRFSGAIADYSVAIEKSDTALYRKLRAKARFENGDYEGALADWAKAREFDPKLGDAPFDKELIAYNKAIANDPDKMAPLLERAHFLVKQARLKNDPGLAAFFPELSGVAGVLVGEPTNAKKNPALELLNAAMKDVDFALKLEPNSAPLWIERARTHAVYPKLHIPIADRGFGDTIPLDDYSRALECDPKNAVAWFERGAYRVTSAKLRAAKSGGAAESEEEERERLALTVADFSRAIYCAPGASGQAHFQRATIERQMPHPDANTLLADYSAAVAPEVKPPGEERSLSSLKLAELGEAHAYRGLLLAGRGQFNAALAAFDEALKNNDDVLPRLERAKLRGRFGEYDGAIADLDEVLKARPDLAEAWFWRGVARDGKGETDKARSDLQEAVKRDATLQTRLRGSRYDARNPGAAGLSPPPNKADVKRVPPGTALEHKTAGNALKQKGDRDGALAEYNAALQIDPNFADALNNRGAIYRESGKVDLAMADLNRAIALDAKHRVAYYNRGLLWRDLGEAVHERADFDRAIEVAVSDESRADAYAERSHTRENADDNEGALQDARHATELNPRSAKAWNRLGNLHLNAGRHADAIASYRRAIDLAPDEVVPRLYLAVALALQNDATAPNALDDALAKADADGLKLIRDNLDRALRLNPDSAPLKALKERTAKATPAK